MKWLRFSENQTAQLYLFHLEDDLRLKFMYLKTLKVRRSATSLFDISVCVKT